MHQNELNCAFHPIASRSPRLGCFLPLLFLPPSATMAPQEVTLEDVKDYYGKVLNTSKDLKTSACTAAGRPHSALLEIFKKIPTEVMEKFYGCGAPLPLGIDGLAVLDLGSGSGRDCYAAAALVGEKGRVTGIDMTAEQLVTARKYKKDGATGQLDEKSGRKSRHSADGLLALIHFPVANP